MDSKGMDYAKPEEEREIPIHVPYMWIIEKPNKGSHKDKY